MTKQGRGTGTLRARRFAEMTKDWSECQHIDTQGRKWTHKVAPGFTCHFTVFADGPQALEWPLGSRVV